MISLRFPVIGSAWMRASIAPALIFIATATDQNYLADFWHHLARGRAMVNEGQLVDRDLFTYTVPGRGFEDVNWLTQLGYYYLYDEGGLGLVRLANSLVLALMMVVLVYHCRHVSGSWAIASFIAVFTFFGLWQVLSIRPQSMSFLLFVLTYMALELAQSRSLFLLAPPVFLAFWANLHGAFPAGLMVVGACLAGTALQSLQRLKRGFWRDTSTQKLALCLGASVLATLLNPYGWHIYQYVSNTSASAAARGIDEWLPPSTGMLIGKAWTCSLLLVIVALALPRRQLTIRDICLMACFLPLACGSARMVPWWLLIIAPIVSRQLAANLKVLSKAEQPERPSFAPAVFFAVIVTAVIFSVPGLDRYNPLLAPARRSVNLTQRQLDEIVDCLSQRANDGRIFSRFEWGEYLTWSVGPRYQVFMDGRIEIFPDNVWNEYSAVTRGRADWENILDEYQVDYLLLDAPYHSNTGLLQQVEQSSRWQQACEAGSAVLFVRRPIS